jgi:hypothetical protein
MPCGLTKCSASDGRWICRYPCAALSEKRLAHKLTDRCAKKVTLFAEILLEIQDQMRCGRNLHCAAVSRMHRDQ